MANVPGQRFIRGAASSATCVPRRREESVAEDWLVTDITGACAFPAHLALSAGGSSGCRLVRTP